MCVVEDVGNEHHALQPLSAISIRAFRAVAHARVYDIVVFVLFSVEILTL